MKLLSFLHRWAGGFIGLLLTIIGLSGAILVWEGQWVTLPGAADPLAEDVAAISRISEQMQARGDLSRITFASEEIGLHQIVFADGGGAYVDQSGRVVDSWSSQWGRPELWIFDLHHYLFAGETGALVTGIAGIAGLLFVATGLILWWRSRRSFAPRLLPQRLAPGPIVKHHRDLGIITAPLLILSLTTGALMLFTPLSTAIVGEEVRPATELPRPAPEAGSPVAAALTSAKRRFPQAHLRRLSLPATAGAPITIRMKQPAEWTPNGRTQLTFDAETGMPLTAEDPLSGNRSAFIGEKLYPIHSAKVGGFAMKLLMSVSGLSLALLGSLATYGFWSRRSAARTRRRRLARAPMREATSALS